MKKKSLLKINSIGFLSAINILILIEVISGFIMLFLTKIKSLQLPIIVSGMFSTYIADIIIIYLFLYKKNESKGFIESIKSQLHINKTTLKKVLLSIVTAFVFYLLTVLIQNYIFLKLWPTTHFSNMTVSELTDSHLGLWAPLITYLVPLVISPFFEELIFRGILAKEFCAFDNKINATCFIIIESIVFGLMHFQSTGSTFSMISAVAIPMLSGILLGVIYLKTKNLSYSIITHSSFNLITILIMTLK